MMWNKIVHCYICTYLSLKANQSKIKYLYKQVQALQDSECVKYITVPSFTCYAYTITVNLC